MKPLRNVLLALAFLTGVISSGGCSDESPYPKTPVVSQIGIAGVCAACGNRIGTVVDRHLFSFQGIQYVVCDEICSTQLQDDIIHEH